MLGETGENTMSATGRKGADAVLRVITLMWLVVCAVQLTIWLLTCVIGGRFQAPFWLWSVGVGGVVVGALWCLLRSSRASD